MLRVNESTINLREHRHGSLIVCQCRLLKIVRPIGYEVVGAQSKARKPDAISSPRKLNGHEKACKINNIPSTAVIEKTCENYNIPSTAISEKACEINNIPSTAVRAPAHARCMRIRTHNTNNMYKKMKIAQLRLANKSQSVSGEQYTTSTAAGHAELCYR